VVTKEIAIRIKPIHPKAIFALVCNIVNIDTTAGIAAAIAPKIAKITYSTFSSVLKLSSYIILKILATDIQAPAKAVKLLIVSVI
jgi:hypothetical protein